MYGQPACRPAIRVYQVPRRPRLRRRFDLLTLTWARSTASLAGAGGEAYHYPQFSQSVLVATQAPGSWELVAALFFID